MKKAILLVAYGPANPHARKSLASFEQITRERFADIPVRWAYSSCLLRDRMALQKQKSDSVTKALLRLHYENFTHVAVQPLQTIAGREHEAVAANARSSCQTSGLICSIGAPLLSGTEPGPIARALLSHIPDSRLPDEHVILMGHGARHPAGKAYEFLSDEILRIDPAVHIATLSNICPLEHILAQIPRGTIWLLPFLSTIGNHALADMAGVGPNSWVNRISRAGHECKPILKGTIESPDICQVWLNNLETALQKFD